MSQYYIAVNGQQMGPYSINELAAQGLKADTLVWTQGMADWQRADMVAELLPLLTTQQPMQGYQQPYQQPGQQPYNNPYGQPQQPYQQPYNDPYGQPQQPYQQPINNPYGQPQQPYQQPGFPTQPDNTEHTNWQPWAIVALIISIFCGGCLALIFAILGMSKASAANRAYDMGDAIHGDQLNSSAKTNTIIALVIDGIALIALFIGIATGAFAEMSYYL